VISPPQVPKGPRWNLSPPPPVESLATALPRTSSGKTSSGRASSGKTQGVVRFIKKSEKKTLLVVKRAIDVIGKNPDWIRDVNRFYFAIFNFILSPKKEQDNEEDIKRYIAQMYVRKWSTFKYSLVTTQMLMASVGETVSLCEVCEMRSGLEFFKINFADVLVFHEDRNWENSKPFKKSLEILNLSELLSDFDTCLKYFCVKYQLSEPIPAGIPEKHWWWITAAEKNVESLSGLWDDDFGTE
ncbi:unnamed protein product, partial [Cyprideis torosa]